MITVAASSGALWTCTTKYNSTIYKLAFGCVHSESWGKSIYPTLPDAVFLALQASLCGIWVGYEVLGGMRRAVVGRGEELVLGMPLASK